MTPPLVSKVSSEIRREHGVGDEDDRVTWTTARISPRGAERPELPKGRLPDEVWPDAMVKLVEAPMVAPLALTKETLPVQDAAVPLDDAVATLVRLMRAVSVLARPKGGRW